MKKLGYFGVLALTSTLVVAQTDPHQNPPAGQTGHTGTSQGGQTGVNESGKASTKTDSMKADSMKSDSMKKSSTKGDSTMGESMVGASDKAFMDKAAEGGIMEVQLAQLAQRQSQNEQVKQLAQKIEQDHTAANKALTDIAQQRSVTLPTALGPAHQKEMDSISKMSGSDFDKAYVKMMVKDHKKDVKEFERASNNLMDSSLKTFASDTLPKLKEHLTTAESLQSGGGMGTRSRTKDTTKDTPKDNTSNK